MPARQLRLIATHVALAVTATHAQSSAVNRPSHQPRAAEFVERLQQAVDAGDRRAVAALVAYPLTVLASGFNIPVKDIATFVTIYNVAITPELRCAIVPSTFATSDADAP